MVSPNNEFYVKSGLCNWKELSLICKDDNEGMSGWQYISPKLNSESMESMKEDPFLLYFDAYDMEQSTNKLFYDFRPE